MFSLLFIKYLSLDNRTRRIAGLSVVFVCALLASVIFLNVAYFDRLSRYAAADTYFYFHLNRSSDSFYQIKIIDAALDNYHLSGIDRHWLGSELALICQNRDGHDYCVLVMIAKKPKLLEKYLIANKTPYKRLARKNFAIAVSPEYLTSIKKNYNIFTRQKYQSALGYYGQLTAVINPRAGAIGNVGRLFSLTKSNRIKFFGQADNEQITLSLSALPFQTVAKTDLVSPNCDLYASLNTGNGDETILKNISTIFSGITSIKLPEKTPVSFCANQKQQTGEILSDFDFSLAIKTPATPELTNEISNNILKVLKSSDPIKETVFLGGKDKVTLLYPNNKYDQAIISSSTIANMPIQLKTSDQAINITNSLNLTTPDSISPSLFVKTAIFDTHPLNQLFKNFYQLELMGEMITLR